MSNCPTCGQELPEMGLKVDLTDNVLIFNRSIIHLTAMEAEVAFVLARHAPEIVRHDHLCAAIYGNSDGVQDERRTISVIMRRLRVKVADLGLSIRSVRGIGWGVSFHPPQSLSYAKWNPEKVERFHQFCKDGTPREVIAQELGWSVAQLKELDKYLRRNQLSRHRLPYSSGIAREVKAAGVKRSRCDA